MAIAGFVKTTLRDWEGIPCCKILLSGCNLNCRYCNSRLNEYSGKTVDFKEILDYIDGKLDFLEGAVISGGEPTCSPDLYGLLKEIKKRKLKVKLDTNGTFPDILDDLIGAKYVDCVCINIMAPLNGDSYSEAAGTRVDVDAIKKTLKTVADSGIECIVRTVAVPGMVDGAAVRSIASAVSFAKRYNLIRFDPGGAADPSLWKTEPYSEAELRKLAENAKGIVRNVGVGDI